MQKIHKQYFIAFKQFTNTPIIIIMNNNKENTEYRTFTYDVCCWCNSCDNEVHHNIFNKKFFLCC